MFQPPFSGGPVGLASGSNDRVDGSPDAGLGGVGASVLVGFAFFFFRAIKVARRLILKGA